MHLENSDRKPKTPTVSFVLVVISESRDLRVTIKQWGDVEEGVVTYSVFVSSSSVGAPVLGLGPQEAC